MPQHDPVPPRRPAPAAAADDVTAQVDSRRAQAWRRYKALMSWMTVAAVGAAALALLYLELSGNGITIHMAIATVAGVGLSVLLGTALMGLVYFSNNSGHDDGVDGRASEGERWDDRG